MDRELLRSWIANDIDEVPTETFYAVVTDFHNDEVIVHELTALNKAKAIEEMDSDIESYQSFSVYTKKGIENLKKALAEVR